MSDRERVEARIGGPRPSADPVPPSGPYLSCRDGSPVRLRASSAASGASCAVVAAEKELAAAHLVPALLLDRSSSAVFDDASGEVSAAVAGVRSVFGPFLRLDWADSPLRWNPLDSGWLPRGRAARSQALRLVAEHLSRPAPKSERAAARAGILAGCQAALWFSELAMDSGPLTRRIPAHWSVVPASLPRALDWLSAFSSDPEVWTAAAAALSSQGRSTTASSAFSPRLLKWMRSPKAPGQAQAAQTRLSSFSGGTIRERSLGCDVPADLLEEGVPASFLPSVGAPPEAAPPSPATLSLLSPSSPPEAEVLSALLLDLLLLRAGALSPHHVSAPPRLLLFKRAAGPSSQLRRSAASPPAAVDWIVLASSSASLRDCMGRAFEDSAVLCLDVPQCAARAFPGLRRRPSGSVLRLGPRGAPPSPCESPPWWEMAECLDAVEPQAGE